MSSKINNIRDKIFYALEIIPTLDHKWGTILFDIYSSIIKDASSIDEKDAHDKFVYKIFCKNVNLVSSETHFLKRLQSSNIITKQNRDEVIGKLKALDFIIKIAVST